MLFNSFNTVFQFFTYVRIIFIMYFLHPYTLLAREIAVNKPKKKKILHWVKTKWKRNQWKANNVAMHHYRWPVHVWFINLQRNLFSNKHSLTQHFVLKERSQSSVFRSVVVPVGSVSLTHSSRKSLGWEEHTKLT